MEKVKQVGGLPPEGYFFPQPGVSLYWRVAPRMLFRMKQPDLFSGQPESVKRLHADATKAKKREARAKARREWWNQHGTTKQKSS